jgi:hypothetical protein
VTYAIIAYILSAILWVVYLLLLSRRTRREVERPRS